MSYSRNVKGDDRYPPRPTRGGKKAATRARLIEAAAELFAERGFRATTLSDIAERAGVTKGAVYYSFDSKESLLLAACGSRGVPADLRAFHDPEEPLEDQLRAFIVDALESMDSPEVAALTPLELELAALAQHDARAREWITAVRHGNRLWMAVLLRDRARHLGIKLPLPYVEMATLLDATMRGLALQRQADPSAVSSELAADAMSMLLGRPARRSRREINSVDATLDEQLADAGIALGAWT